MTLHIQAQQAARFLRLPVTNTISFERFHTQGFFRYCSSTRHRALRPQSCLGQARTMASSAEGASSAAPLKRRSVVSSFIIKYPEDGQEGKPMVALFRRGDKVSTYRHHLAPISGSIENDDASPLAAAWRELNEETTLTPASLELMRQGKSYVFSDPSVGREWTIYPFAYRLKAPESAIQIDWEHEDWGWYDPMDVEDTDAFGGVPRLAESLRRAYFEKDLGTGPGSAGAALADGLQQLHTDHQSGARELATEALRVLKNVVQALKVKEGPTTVALEEWWRLVRIAAWHIWKNGRESMGAAILSVLLGALKSIEDTLRQHQQHPESAHSLKWRDSTVQDLDRRISLRTTSSAEPVAQALIQHLEQTFLSSSDGGSGKKPLSILTLSESSTIAHSLRRLVSQSGFTSIDLRVLESRPLFEGVSMAASLVRYIQSDIGPAPAATQTKVTVYTDASAALAAEGVDVVLLGADRIASSGAVSNKTGSLPAVLSAKLGQPDGRPASQSSAAKVVVLGETDKIATPGDPRQHVVEDNDPVQLTRAWHSSFNSERVRDAADCLDSTAAAATGGIVDVQVHNIFFEWVPSRLIDTYVTETGIWTVADIARHSKALADEEERMFKDL